MKLPRTNPKNDRAKREYLIYMQDARQRSPATVEQVRHAIDRLESFTSFKDFGTFNKEQALSFKRALLASKAQRSGKPISRISRRYRPRCGQGRLPLPHRCREDRKAD